MRATLDQQIGISRSSRPIRTVLVCNVCVRWPLHVRSNAVQRPLLPLASCRLDTVHHIQSIQPNLCGLDRSGPALKSRCSRQVQAGRTACSPIASDFASAIDASGCTTPCCIGAEAVHAALDGVCSIIAAFLRAILRRGRAWKRLERGAAIKRQHAAKVLCQCRATSAATGVSSAAREPSALLGQNAPDCAT